MCKEGSIELAKFVCSSSNVLKFLDPSLIASKVKVDFSETINERSLGVNWHVNNDNLFYSVQQPQEIYTRRKVLSTIASVFDPMGLVSPFVLLGKQILQEACSAGLNWDDELPDPLKHRYKEWCQQLQDLSSIRIPRCVKPPNFNVSSVEFHHFADASTSGYGVCSYIRYIDHNGSVSVSLVYAKSRVSPIKPVTIPRLELTAAVLAVRCSVMLEREFKFEGQVKHFFYSDSTVVLGYISNSTRRYQLFVANRVGVIQSLTSVSQWSHVAGKQNPADLASRGCLPTFLPQSIWFTGPPFLYDPGPMSYSPLYYPLAEKDENIRKVVTTCAVMSSLNFYEESLSHFLTTHVFHE